MVQGLRKTGDLLARSDLCHLHDVRAEAESCAIDPRLQCQDRSAAADDRKIETRKPVGNGPAQPAHRGRAGKTQP